MDRSAAEIRKDVIRLENELDQKLLKLSNVLQPDTSATSSTSPSPASASSSSSSSSQSSSTELSNEAKCQNFETEIIALLENLGSLIHQMSISSTTEIGSIGGGGGGGGSASLPAHVIQRHRDLLYDRTQEFKVIRANVAQSLNRARLLSSVRQDIGQHKLGLNSRSNRLLNERDTIITTENLTDNAISQAQATKNRLDIQRESFTNIRGKVTDLRTSLPIVDTVISRIQRRKKRNLIIISIVIAACVILTFLYILS